jgi:hypothetical protein
MLILRRLRFGTFDPRLCTLDQQITFELRDRISKVHGHLAGGAGEISTTKLQAVNSNA